MYCAYTIPGMTGSSLMYYYNGKAVRKASSSLSSRLVFPSWKVGGGGGGKEGGRGRGGVKVRKRRRRSAL